jgi:hypothetical protein
VSGLFILGLLLWHDGINTGENMSVNHDEENGIGTVITEKTLLPVSLVIVIIGGVFWLTTLHSKVNANEKELDEINGIEQGTLRSQIIEANKALARIEGHLGTKAGDK